MFKKKKEVRFIEIYKSFSESERKEFGEFISISLFNKGRNYNGILNNLSIRDNGDFDLLDSKKDRTQWNRLSELSILAEKFLTLKNLDSNKFSGELLLLNELNKRDIIHLYNQKFNSLRKSTDTQDFSLNKVNELLKIYSIYLTSKSSISNIQKRTECFYNAFDLRYLKFVIGFLDFMINRFYIEKSKLSHSVSHREEILQIQDINRILVYINNHMTEYYPLVSFYYYIYKALLNPDDTYNYFVARKLLMNDFKDASKEFRSVLISYLVDYNALKINISGQSKSKELLYFVNIKIKDGTLDEDMKNDFQNYNFITYTMNALALNKMKWAENFVRRFEKFLPARNRDSGVLLAKAYIEYYRKDFDACKRLLDRMNTFNSCSYIDSAKLNLRACYELKKFEECFIVIKRLQEYIRVKENISDVYIISTRQFCSAYVLLLRLNEKPSRDNLIKLEHKLSKGRIDGKNWIERKIKEINIL